MTRCSLQALRISERVPGDPPSNMDPITPEDAFILVMNGGDCEIYVTPMDLSGAPVDQPFIGLVYRNSMFVCTGLGDDDLEDFLVKHVYPGQEPSVWLFRELLTVKSRAEAERARKFIVKKALLHQPFGGES